MQEFEENKNDNEKDRLSEQKKKNLQLITDG